MLRSESAVVSFPIHIVSGNVSPLLEVSVGGDVVVIGSVDPVVVGVGVVLLPEVEPPPPPMPPTMLESLV